MTWVIMGAAIGVECLATICLRMADGLSRPLWLVPSALSYITTFVLVSMVLQRGWSMAVTYAVCAAGGIALIALTGAVFLDEELHPTAIVGLVLTMAGLTRQVPPKTSAAPPPPSSKGTERVHPADANLNPERADRRMHPTRRHQPRLRALGR